MTNVIGVFPGYGISVPTEWGRPHACANSVVDRPAQTLWNPILADRFDKFTASARRVLTLAQEEAQRFGHNYIGTEHILLGLVREGDANCTRALDNLGITLDKVRLA